MTSEVLTLPPDLSVRLVLRGCDLKSVRDLEISNDIEELDVSVNPLGLVGGLEISSLLEKFPKIKILKIGDCDLPLPALIAILHFSENLTDLEISNPRTRSLLNEHCEHLGRRLGGLRRLGFARASVSDSGLALLLAGGLGRLQDLDLSGNQLGFRGARELQRVLTGPGNFLKRLNLRANRLGCQGDLDSARALAEGLGAGNCNLEILDLNFNQFSGRALELLGPPALSRLAELYIFENLWDESSRRNFQVWSQGSGTRLDFGFQDMHIFKK